MRDRLCPLTSVKLRQEKDKKISCFCSPAIQISKSAIVARMERKMSFSNENFGIIHMYCDKTD